MEFLLPEVRLFLVINSSHQNTWVLSKGSLLTVTNLQQRVVRLESNSSGAYTNKGFLPQKSMIPKNFTDKADEWRRWQEEVADHVDTMTPGMKKVLAEIDQETDVIDDLWRRAGDEVRQGDGEEHTNLWRLLRRITESKKVVMSIKDEDGLRAWQRLKQRFEPGLAARQGIVMAEFSGMVARPAESLGKSIALLTEMDRKMKLVEDVTGEEVSEMHARSVLVGSCDPPTHRHEPFEVIRGPQEDRAANNSTTSQEAMQIGRVEAGATAPKTGWPPSVAETSEDSWEECGAINGSQQCWACPAQDTVTCPRTVPMARARARAHTNGARATSTGTRAATAGCTREVERPTFRALMVPSRGTRRVTASLEAKDPVMASATLAVEIISQEIAAKVEEKEGLGHW